MSRVMTYADALNAALHQAMSADERVILIGEDIAGGTGLDSEGALGGVFGVATGLHEAFGPDRVIDTPISETAFVGMALGAAMTGLRPVVEIMFCDFMGVCFDQIINQIAKVRFLSGGKVSVPLVIRTTMGAGDGSGAMHSQSLAHLVASIPGLKVVMPSTPADAAGMLLGAVQDDGPVIMFEHKGLYDLEGDVPGTIEPLPLDKAGIVRSGRDVTIAATSRMVLEALGATESLASQGVVAEVIDLRSVAPVDTETLFASVRKTGHLAVVDEGAAHFGIASEIAARVQAEVFHDLKAPVAMITPPHTPVPYASDAESVWLPGKKDIVDAVLKMRGQS